MWQPQEYPVNMARMYAWTPDEAVPEFYCDASVLRSMHPEMLDLAVPDWADSPDDFVRQHR